MYLPNSRVVVLPSLTAVRRGLPTGYHYDPGSVAQVQRRGSSPAENTNLIVGVTVGVLLFAFIAAASWFLWTFRLSLTFRPRRRRRRMAKVSSFKSYRSSKSYSGRSTKSPAAPPPAAPADPAPAPDPEPVPDAAAAADAAPDAAKPADPAP